MEMEMRRPFALIFVMGLQCWASSATAQTSAAGHDEKMGAMHGHAASQAENPASQAENPDPMAMMESMEATDRWATMLHGYAYVNGNRQGGHSGDRAFESQNHIMALATRRWLGGKLSLRGTFTLEPATIRKRGSPQLFQRGEAYRGVLLVDRQHPRSEE